MSPPSQGKNKLAQGPCPTVPALESDHVQTLELAFLRGRNELGMMHTSVTPVLRGLRLENL